MTEGILELSYSLLLAEETLIWLFVLGGGLDFVGGRAAKKGLVGHELGGKIAQYLEQD